MGSPGPTRATNQREALVMAQHMPQGWEQSSSPRAPGWLRRLGEFPPPGARRRAQRFRQSTSVLADGKSDAGAGSPVKKQEELSSSVAEC